MPQTIIQYVLSRLRQLGVTDVFGVPGDYAFPITDAICADKNMQFVGSCNEINAAYSADGYARIKGLAAVNTTSGPGELNALSGIAGAYAEHVPIFHLTAQPSRTLQRDRAIVHHTLGNGEFDLFYDMTAPAVCARTIVTPENCIAETERLIAAALYHRRPVYMAFPMDVPDQPVLGEGRPYAEPQSNPASLESAVKAIVDAVTRAKTACVLPGYLVARAGLRREATAVIDASGLPFAAMFMDKATLDEAHPNYIGMYDGRLMEDDVRAFVEGADCVLGLGALWSDFNTGAFTARLNLSKTINVFHHSTRVGNAYFEDVEMKDVLTALAQRLPKPALEPLPEAGRYSRRRDWHQLDGTGPRETAQGHDVPQSDALGRDRLGDARRLRGRGRGARSSHGADHRRRLPPAYRAGGWPVPPPRPEADHLPSEQQWLFDRAPALQGPGHLLQRSRAVALPPAAAGAGLRRLVHGARRHLRGNSTPQ